MITYEGKICPPTEGKIAIVVARFNGTITERLLQGALAKLKQNGVPDKNIVVVRVPGAFEIPMIAQRLAEDEDNIAVICLGCVIKGETTHDQHINRAVSSEIARISCEMQIPVIFGLLTCNTAEQAEARSGMNEQSTDKVLDPTPGNKGAEAAEAALEMLDLLTMMPELDDENEEEGYSSGFSIAEHARKYRSGEYNRENEDSDFDDDDDDEGKPFPVREERWKFDSDAVSKKKGTRNDFGSSERGRKRNGSGNSRSDSGRNSGAFSKGNRSSQGGSSWSSKKNGGKSSSSSKAGNSRFGKKS